VKFTGAVRQKNIDGVNLCSDAQLWRFGMITKPRDKTAHSVVDLGFALRVIELLMLLLESCQTLTHIT